MIEILETINRLKEYTGADRVEITADDYSLVFTFRWYKPNHIGVSYRISEEELITGWFVEDKVKCEVLRMYKENLNVSK